MRNPSSFDPEAAASTLRSEEPTPEQVAAAHDRVAAVLAAAERAQHDVPGSIAGCPDFAALIPAYLSGALPEARRVLVEDHTHSCVSCRKVLMVARSARGGTVPAPAARPVAVPAWRRPLPLLAMAASTLLALAGGFWVVRHVSGGAVPAGALATVERVDGTLLSPTEASTTAARVGSALDARGSLRTGRQSRAVLRLADGSRVELGERSEVAVAAAPGGMTVRLARGRVLVEAAKQTGGRHLAVTTPDCAVSVVGTVFAVNYGTGGSRVSVLEGEVKVSSGKRTRALRPGEQTTSREGGAAVPISEEVAWSADHERWQKLATELQGLQADLSRAFPTPGLHHDTRLLDVAPAGSVVYAAVPNLSGGLREAWKALATRVEQGGALAEALGSELATGPNRARIDEAVDVLADVGERLGDEIALAVVTGPDGKVLGPVVYAEARRPRELREVLESLVVRVNGKAGKPVLRLVDDASARADGAASLAGGVDANGPTLLLAGDFLAVGFEEKPLSLLAAGIQGVAGSTLAGSTLARRVADAYRLGVHDVVAADLRSLIGRAGHSGTGAGTSDEALARLGILDAEGLVVTRRVEGETARTEATLSFGQTRRGIAAWLAAPAPLGALDYVSSEATLAAAFAVKEPKALADELLSIFSDLSPDFRANLQKAESELGFEVSRDLAATLGGDLALAVDGPLLPVPALKLVIEVYDPARLQDTFERLVGKLDREARAKGQAGFELVSTTVGGKLYHAVRRSGSDPLVHWTFDHGYLVAGADRAVLSRALETRASQMGLRSSGDLAGMLPKDGPLDVSALVYQNLGPVLRTSSAPSLGWARGEDDRIVLGATGPAGLAGLDLPGILGRLAEGKSHR